MQLQQKPGSEGCGGGGSLDDAELGNVSCRLQEGDAGGSGGGAVSPQRALHRTFRYKWLLSRRRILC